MWWVSSALRTGGPEAAAGYYIVGVVGALGGVGAVAPSAAVPCSTPFGAIPLASLVAETKRVATLGMATRVVVRGWI